MNNKIVKSLALAAVTSFSVSSMAFAPPVRARVEPKALEMPAPVRVQGVEPKVGSTIKLGNTLNLKSDIVVGEKSAAKGKTCDAKLFDEAAEGISVPSTKLADFQKRRLMNIEGDDCGQAFKEMTVDAREIAAETVECSDHEGIEFVSDLNQRKVIGGGCMLKVKTQHGQKTTLPAATQAWSNVREKCQFVL